MWIIYVTLSTSKILKSREKQLTKSKQNNPKNNVSNLPENQEGGNSERVLTQEEINQQLTALHAPSSDYEEKTSPLATKIGYVRKHDGLPPTKKSLGQNWLSNSLTAYRIVEILNPAPGDFVLEIGPGGGALTYHLLNKPCKLAAIEIDQRMFASLEKLMTEIHPFQLIHGDILSTDFHEILGDAPFSVIGNLPYHITSSLFFKFFDQARLHPGTLKRAVLMVQYEVARRIASQPGDSEYGILSIFARLWGEPRLALKVPRQDFSPAPKVDAGIIVMDFTSEPRYPLNHWPTFKSWLKALSQCGGRC